MTHDRSAALVLVMVAVWFATGCVDAHAADGWHRAKSFDERWTTHALDPGVRLHVNVPSTDGPARGTLLIVYALPNGNTIEQTLGCRMADGLDWHYDIQHVAAQVRLLRAVLPAERIVLLCAEADGLSWPRFRGTQPDANRTIAGLLQDWREAFGEPDARVILTGHSGGGSFMLGAIEGSEAVPAWIERIAFLDANYSFDDALHGKKLARWLENEERRLVVLAYDDREITYNGKKVVGPTGGTYRATQRMRESLGQRFELESTRRGMFEVTTGLGGRVHFYVHTNPENKILHTSLVGEMNGLAHVVTLGTPQEESWGTFGGPRAYGEWVQAEPTPREPGQMIESAGAPKIPPLNLPPRSPEAMSGSEFVRSIAELELDAREAAIHREISHGNFPQFLRTLVRVPIRGRVEQGGESREIESYLEVMPDYLAIGSDDDFVRMPMRPQTAQRIADAFGFVLPTRKMVDAIDASATVQVEPRPLVENREAVATFAEHNRMIHSQLASTVPGQLVTGIKKDIVLTPRLLERPRRLAIYGWRQLDGEPIQPLSIVHWDRYVDYSHGARLVRNRIRIGKHVHAISDVLADPRRAALLSDEGPMQGARYVEQGGEVP